MDDEDSMEMEGSESDDEPDVAPLQRRAAAAALAAGGGVESDGDDESDADADYVAGDDSDSDGEDESDTQSGQARHGAEKVFGLVLPHAAVAALAPCLLAHSEPVEVCGLFQLHQGSSYG